MSSERMTQDSETAISTHLLNGGASDAETAAYIRECERARAQENTLLSEVGCLRKALEKFTVAFEFAKKQAGPNAKWSLGYWHAFPPALPDFVPVIEYTPDLAEELRGISYPTAPLSLKAKEAADAG